MTQSTVVSLAQSVGYEDDDGGVMISSTNENGVETKYVHDARGWQTQVIEDYADEINPLRRTQAFDYDPAGNLLSETRWQKYDWEVAGGGEAAVGVTTSYAYDAADRRTWVIEAFGKSGEQRATRLRYDEAGNNVAETRWAEYGTAINDSALKAASAITTSYVYDPVNRVTAVVEAANKPEISRTTRTDLDQAGNVAATIHWQKLDAALAGLTDDQKLKQAVVTSYEYDGLNQQTFVIEAPGTKWARTTEQKYDPVGNIVSVTAQQTYATPTTAAVFVTTSFVYDKLDRQTEVHDAWGTELVRRSSKTDYDAVGNPVLVTDVQGVQTKYDYDALDRVTKVHEAFGLADVRVAETGYTPTGQIARQIDARGVITKSDYDRLDRKTEVIEAFWEAGVWYSKDLQRTTHFRYDAQDNVIRVETPRDYDEQGGGDLATTFGYDALDRQVSQTEAANYTPETWAPDASGTLTAMLPHERPVTTTVYDPFDQVVSMTDPLNRVTSHAYDALHREVDTWENWSNAGTTQQGRNTHREYDAADNLTAITTGKVIGPLATQTPSHWVRNAYEYDAIDRKTKETLAIDAQGSLPLLKSGAPVTEFGYDAADNLVRTKDPRGIVTIQQFDVLNRLTDSFEATGKEVERHSTYAYDSRDQLRSETHPRFHAGQLDASGKGPDGSPNLITTSYAYDPLGRQTEKHEAWGTTEVRTTKSEYDQNDNVFRFFDPLGTETLLNIDALGRKTHVITAVDDLLQRTSVMVYDAADNLVKVVTPRVYDSAASSNPVDHPETSFFYDALNRKTVTIEAANVSPGELGHASPVTRTEYGITGLILSQVSPVQIDSFGKLWSARTKYDYDAFDRIVKVTDGAQTYDTPGFNSLRFATKVYDGADNLTSESTGHSTSSIQEHLVATTYMHDALNRVTRIYEKIDESSSRLSENTYDPNGNLTEVSASLSSLVKTTLADLTTSAKNYLKQVQITAYEYDPLNRNTKVTLGAVDEAEVRTWIGDNGNSVDLISLNKDLLGHAPVSTTKKYDARDNSIEESNPLGAVIRIGYDLLNRKVREEYPTDINPTLSGGGPLTTYAYDNLRFARVAGRFREWVLCII